MSNSWKRWDLTKCLNSVQCPFDGESDGLKDADVSSSCGFNDGPDASTSVQTGTPDEPEAVGDLAEDGPQGLCGRLRVEEARDHGSHRSDPVFDAELGVAAAQVELDRHFRDV